MTSTIPYHADTILVIDDEPMYLEWLSDYVNGLGLKAKFVENADDAIETCASATYRAYVVDLNIPASPKLKTDPQNRTNLSAEYPGLIVARTIRTSGESGSRVIIYSVYVTDALHAEVNRLGCTYVQKGRPRILKEQLQDVLKRDPKSTRAGS